MRRWACAWTLTPNPFINLVSNPKHWLACRSKWLAGLAGIWVRPVDKLVGEAVGMRVDVELADGTTAVGIYYHRLLSQSVGCAVSLAAFLSNCEVCGHAIAWCLYQQCNLYHG